MTPRGHSLIGLSVAGVLLATLTAAAPIARTSLSSVTPVIGKPVTVPVHARAGERFGIAFKVTRSDTRTPLMKGRMISEPSIAGEVIPHTEAFRGGTARSSFVVPTSAPGKLLKIKLTITAAGGASATRVATFRVRAPQPVTARVTASPQLVFDWTTDRCALWDVPDLSARAFRDAAGHVQLIASHFATRRFLGPDLEHLRHDCSAVFVSHRNPDPAAYDDAEWIAATFTSDGSTIYALVHDEYQGHRHPGQCPSGSYGRCWWNTITSAVSTDGGRTYVHSTPPALVATYPYRYVPDRGSFGALQPSNIVHNRDGYYYALVDIKEQPQGAPNTNHLCLIRTKELADPSSWRAWSGGTAFSTTFIDPYRSTVNPADHLCRAVSPSSLGGLPLGSLTFVTEANQWLLVGAIDDGFYYSTSSDLINWTRRRLLLAAPLPWTYRCGGPDPIHYPSVLDPASASRNFETTGKTAYLYYTQFHTQNCQQGPDRDLVRVPISIDR